MNIHNWLKQTKKELIYLFILIILLVVLANYLHSNVSEEQEKAKNPNEIVVSNKLIQKEYVYSNMDKNTVKIASMDEPVAAETTDEIEFEYYYDSIPLSEEVQQFTWEMANEYSISYELVLAIAKVESNYDADVVSHTRDSGLMQIHKPTGKWIAEELELKEYDVFDPETNILMGIWYLDWLHSYYLSQGYSEEDTFQLVVLAYNRGHVGAVNYVNKYGFNNSYLDKVYAAKIELEMEGGE
jgi:soluble lytic murein transglycosylase-like protein